MKTCLITGGSRGIGAAAVRKFAKENYTVILNYFRSEVCAQNLRDSFVAEGCDVHLFRADVSNCAEVAAMFAFAEKYFKHLDVLVNNAGVALYRQCQDVSEKEFDNVMSVNAKGAFFCSAAAVKMFLRQGRGSIVNVSSIWGLDGASCESVYSMSKHAVVGLTKSLAKELAPSNIRVNCVCPSVVRTDMCGNLSQNDITAFCTENDVKQQTAEQVANGIFQLAECSQTGVVLTDY